MLASACAPNAREEAPGLVERIPDGLPEQWVGAKHIEGRIEVTLAELGGSPEIVASYPTPDYPELVVELDITDLAFLPGRSTAFLAILGEPVSGTVVEIDLSDPPGDLEGTDQGTAVDVLAEAYIRTDSHGSFALRAGTAGSEPELRADTGIADVALARAGGNVRFAALVDRNELAAVPRGSIDVEPELLVGEPGDDGWSERTVSLAGAGRFCRIAFVTADEVGLVRAAEEQSDRGPCLGSRVDVIQLASGSVRESTFVFPEPVRHVSADDSSRYLIYTTVSGAVGWYSTEDGKGGELAPNAYHAADW